MTLSFIGGSGVVETTLETRDPNMPYVDDDSTFDILRPDPRFQTLMRRKKNSAIVPG